MSNPALSNAHAPDAKPVLLLLTLAKYWDVSKSVKITDRFTCTSQMYLLHNVYIMQ